MAIVGKFDAPDEGIRSDALAALLGFEEAAALDVERARRGRQIEQDDDASRRDGLSFFDDAGLTRFDAGIRV